MCIYTLYIHMICLLQSVHHIMEMEVKQTLFFIALHL
jgi:hypothetical protein